MGCIMGYVLACHFAIPAQSLNSEFIPASEARAIFCILMFCFIILKMYYHHQTAEKSQFISLQPHKKSLIKNTGMSYQYTNAKREVCIILWASFRFEKYTI